MGGAAGLDIVEFPLTLLQPLASSAATIYLILLSTHSVPSLGNHGSQPECKFDIKLPLLIPMGLFILICYILASVSATRSFNRTLLRGLSRCLGCV